MSSPCKPSVDRRATRATRSSRRTTPRHVHPAVLLGDTLDTEKVKADYQHGVLTVTIPTAEVAKARKVEVSGTGEDKAAIEAGGSETSSKAQKSDAA